MNDNTRQREREREREWEFRFIWKFCFYYYYRNGERKMTNHWTVWNDGQALALFNWNNHLMIRALRSITDRDVGETTVRFIVDGLVTLSNVVWSDNDKRLTLSKMPSSEFSVVEFVNGEVDERNAKSTDSNGIRSLFDDTSW